MNIKLNCDIGESFGIWKMGQDELIFPHIDMANLACGFHASDPQTMYDSVALAVKNDVSIGAHIAYQDLIGFGRRSLNCTPQEIHAKSLYQMGALEGFCKIFDTSLDYVKPHGALYNDMMKNDLIFESIVKAISSFDQNIKLMVLSTLDNQRYKIMAQNHGVELLYEVFADRNYTNTGHLVPRTQSNALIHDTAQILQRIENLKNEGYILTSNGDKLFLDVDTICVHGDNENALEFIKLLRQKL